MLALPLAASFVSLEIAAGGMLALYCVAYRGEVSRGFFLFTGWCVWLAAALATWLRAAFPPPLDSGWAVAGTALAVERALTIGFVMALLALLVAQHRSAHRQIRWLAPATVALGLAGLGAAALVQPSRQLAGPGAPLAALAGATALGAALVGLSLGHWYLVAPALSTRPLLRVTWLSLGAIGVQAALLPALLWPPGEAGARPAALLGEHLLFFAVRVGFGLVVPTVALIMVWRTARIRSLDSATGLLYVAATLVLVGEISARSLFFLTGVAT